MLSLRDILNMKKFALSFFPGEKILFKEKEKVNTLT